MLSRTRIFDCLRLLMGCGIDGSWGPNVWRPSACQMSPARLGLGMFTTDTNVCLYTREFQILKRGTTVFSRSTHSLEEGKLCEARDGDIFLGLPHLGLAAITHARSSSATTSLSFSAAYPPRTQVAGRLDRCMAWLGVLVLLVSASVLFFRNRMPSIVSGLLRSTRQHHLKPSREGERDNSHATPEGPDEVLIDEVHTLAGGRKDSIVAPRIVMTSESDFRQEASARTNGDFSSVPSEAQDKSPNEVSAAALMPPPPRPQPKAAVQSKTSSASSALRIPSTGPLPNRLPPTTSSLSRPNTTTTSLSAASASTLAPSARPRKKVILQPGHSPLDWAHLTQTSSGQELSGVPYPQRITSSQLAFHTGRKGKPAWSSYKGKVYNIGPYLPFHPGGEGELMKAAGRDGAKLFEEVHPWVNWDNMMGACLVGFLVPDAEAAAGGGAEHDLESLD